MPEKITFPLELVLTPDGFVPELPGSRHTEDGEALLARWKENRCKELYHQGQRERPEGLSPLVLYLYTVAEAFFRAPTSLPELELLRERARALPSEAETARLLQAVPFVIGAEYVNRAWLEGLFLRLNEVFSEEIGVYSGTVAFYLAEQSRRLRVPERVFLHIVESRDEAFPFAFLATYATEGKNGQISHVPLQYALTEYKNEREKLLELLACLNRAAEVSPLIGAFMESGELLHPLKLTVEETFQLLKYAEELEQAGILCRVPNWWRKRNAAVSLSISLGGKKPSMVGFSALVEVQPELAVDGIPDQTDAGAEKAVRPYARGYDRHTGGERFDQSLVSVRLFEQGASGFLSSLQDVLQGSVWTSGPRAAPGCGPWWLPSCSGG